VVLCSDGLPSTGATQASGRYNASDHENYSYANAVYRTDRSLKKNKYFIYALGFFHNSEGQDLKFGKKLMKDLASKDKYYVVTNTKDIDKVFQDVAEKITKTSISKSSLTLYVGEHYKLNAQVNGVKKSASWKSSKSSVATVNSKGKVTAKAVGTATITATVNGTSVTCKVTVKKKKTAAAKASISLNKTSASIYVNKSVQLRATVTGNSKTVTWTSSNSSVATVTKNGKVKGKSAGKAVITATANGVSATCTVTVDIKHPEYSQYFMVEPKKSSYGSKLIDEYGCRLMVNANAVVTKCAVYVKKEGSVYKRTLAFTGSNIEYAYYVPYLARNGKSIYDGTNSSRIITRRMYKNSDGIWSLDGRYTLMTANLKDASGNSLAVQSTGVSGRNTKIFDDLDEMKKWLSE
jgi:hypothetical protein